MKTLQLLRKETPRRILDTTPIPTSALLNYRRVVATKQPLFGQRHQQSGSMQGTTVVLTNLHKQKLRTNAKTKEKVISIVIVASAMLSQNGA